MWWPRRKCAYPGTGRLPDGRLIDGDTVRLPGQARWADLIDQDHTRLLPIITPAMRHRGQGAYGTDHGHPRV